MNRITNYKQILYFWFDMLAFKNFTSCMKKV